MHTDPKYVTNWVEYSTFDAEITYFLRETLAYELMKQGNLEENMTNMLELYNKYWVPFGEVLTDMEREGIRIDVEYLKMIEMEATKDKIEYEQKFLDWVHKYQEDASEFNPSSAQQMQ
jgi:DNA polymerase I